MNATRMRWWFTRAVLAHYDRRALPRQSLKGWRGVWHCIDMVLWFTRWAAAVMAVAAVVLMILYPGQAALVY